uniref:Uncharacterized protein n=1 Tax=Oryza punctata TaxID=4537 RepID=A0A0E0JX03_ORYPU
MMRGKQENSDATTARRMEIGTGRRRGDGSRGRWVTRLDGLGRSPWSALHRRHANSTAASSSAPSTSSMPRSTSPDLREVRTAAGDTTREKEVAEALPSWPHLSSSQWRAEREGVVDWSLSQLFHPHKPRASAAAAAAVAVVVVVVFDLDRARVKEEEEEEGGFEGVLGFRVEVAGVGEGGEVEVSSFSVAVGGRSRMLCC